MKSLKYWLGLFLILPVSVYAWQWLDLWQTADQQGSKLMQAGKPQAASQVFKNSDWQGVAHYRSGNFAQAFEQFSSKQTSDGQYNAGNAAAYLGKYQEALAAYEKAIALNPNNTDAITNRDIVKKLLKQQQKQQNQQQKNSSSADKHKDKQNNSRSPQNKAKQNSSQNNQTDKNKQSNKNNQPDNDQINKNKQTDKNNQTNKNTQPQQNPQQLPQNNAQNNKEQIPPKNPKPPQPKAMPQNEQTAMSSAQQKQDENNKQLLRRLTDDPGGLLQQKFLRDYLRRHGEKQILDQGVIND